MVRVIKKFKFQALLSLITIVSIAMNFYLVFLTPDEDLDDLVGDHDEAFFTETELDIPQLLEDAVIGRRDTVNSLLTAAGVAEPDVLKVTQAINQIFPLKNIKPGNKLVFDDIYKSYEGANERVTLNKFHILTDQSKVEVVLDPEKNIYTAKHIILPLETKTKLVTGSVKGSLFSSVKKAGVEPKAAMEFINLLSYVTDFQRDLRPGDYFKVLYEYQVNHEGKIMTKPKVIYGSLVAGNGEREVFRHVMKSGKVDYFDAKGHSVKRALLRTPINGAKISSGFGLRSHPVLGYSKMHKGLDYRAAAGTPILAAGDGVVELVKNQARGYGKHIQIKHNGTYSTLYAHMSKFAPGIKPGIKVTQGQVIGNVGNTGMTTGAHLHYEVVEKGQKVNPTKVSFPKIAPLKGLELAKFQDRIISTEKMVAELESGKKTIVAQGQVNNQNH